MCDKKRTLTKGLHIFIKRAEDDKNGTELDGGPAKLGGWTGRQHKTKPPRRNGNCESNGRTINKEKAERNNIFAGDGGKRECLNEKRMSSKE